MCSRLYAPYHYSTTTTTTTTLTADARKLANKQRRQAGRERHEERKVQLKQIKSDTRWQHIERESMSQRKRPDDDGAGTFVGRNVDNHRAACSHLDTAPEESQDLEDEKEREVDVSRGDVPLATSGAMLLAMARPAKIHRNGRRRRRPSILEMTDGELFEVVEVDGRLVALDEDGWEILPDENAEASLLYSDIVRGDVI